MRRIDRYLFREVAEVWLAAQCVFVVLFLGTEALTEAAKLISRYGLPWLGVVRLVLLQMPWALAWTMPMSTGMAVILALGRLCSDGEYTAIVVGGASFRRVMAPMLLFAIAITGVALWVQEYFGPATKMEYYTSKLSLQAKARADLQDFHVRLSSFDQQDRVLLQAERLDARAKMLYTVELNVTRQGDELYSVTAKRGQWDNATHQWVLYDGRYRAFKGTREIDGTFEQSTVRDLAEQAGYNGTVVFESEPNEVSIYGTDKPDYLVGPQIRQRIRWMRQQQFTPREINRVVIYLHRRYALGTSCFLFVLLGAPLAIRPLARSRSNRATSFAIALALILGYYIIWQATSLLGEGSRWPLAWAWSTNVIGTIVGLTMWRWVPD